MTNYSTDATLHFNIYRELLNNVLKNIDQNSFEEVSNIIKNAILHKQKIFVCGNGGSAAIAEHLSCDFGKGISHDTTHYANIMALGSNQSLITAISNDIGYEHIFSKQLEWFAERNNILIAISSSGNSPNIVNAIETAIKKGLITICFVGFDGGKAAKIVDHCVHVESDNYGVIEDAHSILMHVIAQHIRINYAKNLKSVKL